MPAQAPLGSIYNDGDGVHIVDGSNGNFIEADSIDHNAENGVEIDCSSSTTVSNCVIEYNVAYGILVSGSAGTKLSNNTVSHNGLGNVKD